LTQEAEGLEGALVLLGEVVASLSEEEELVGTGLQGFLVAQGGFEGGAQLGEGRLVLGAQGLERLQRLGRVCDLVLMMGGEIRGGQEGAGHEEARIEGGGAEGWKIGRVGGKGGVRYTLSLVFASFCASSASASRSFSFSSASMSACARSDSICTHRHIDA
jgi:hypothetical protein